MRASIDDDEISKMKREAKQQSGSSGINKKWPIVIR